MATIQTTNRSIAISPPVSKRELDELKTTANELAEKDSWHMFLHGWNSSGSRPQEWLLNIEDVLKELGIKTIRPDLPNSIAPSAYQQLSVALRHMMKLEGHGQVTGHSMGGVLAMKAVPYLPERYKLDSLITIGSPRTDLWGIFPTFYDNSFERAEFDKHVASITHIQSIKDHKLDVPWRGWEAHEHAHGWADATGGDVIFLPGDDHFGHTDRERVENVDQVLATLLRNHIVSSLIRRNSA